MGPRPAPLDLSRQNGDKELQPPRYPDFHLDLPSPRPGEIPPALSPLDAFAVHSRMLQKKFEEEAEKGRRVSRLSYDTVARQLATRVNTSKHDDNGDMEDIAEVQENSRPTTSNGAVISTTAPKTRPKSQYPTTGRVSRLDDSSRSGTPFFDAREEQIVQPSANYFDGSRTASPEPTDPRVNVEAPSPNVPSLTSSMDSLSSGQAPRVLPDRTSRSLHNGLLPARSSFIPKSPRSMQSIRAVRQDSGDDETASQNGVTSNTLSPRKFSGSSGMSQPQSPFTPSFTHFAHRSPSMTSEYSMNGFQNSPRPIMNFSRPDRPMSPDAVDVRSSMESRRSLDSRPSRDVMRHLSVTSNGTTTTASPPRSSHSFRAEIPKPFANDNGASDSDADSGAGRTYTYSKYKLPRGRNIDRISAGFRTSWIERQFNWDEDEKTSTVKASTDVTPEARPTRQVEPVAAPVSVRRRPSTPDLLMPQTEVYELPASSILPARPAFGPSHKTTDNVHTFTPPRPSSPASIRNSIFSELRRGRERAFSSMNRSHSADPRGNATRPKTSHTPSASIATDSTDHTVLQPTIDPRKITLDVTPEDHLEIGIQAHSAGQTNKSTYHLRLAAKAGLPTAMLLYALACRHGWGMRANQEEGVKWLRKAIDDTRLSEEDLDARLSNATRRSGILDPATEAIERRKRKAQFALAVYELGISYANGWGCTKDRGLALRCYEIAGKWGDCDALAEAGYCYTQGLGCKKDMHKAAALYRAAAAGGMSMAGNSWIYKDKYNERLEGKKSIESGSARDGKEPKQRARSRSIWGRPKKEK